MHHRIAGPVEVAETESTQPYVTKVKASFAVQLLWYGDHLVPEAVTTYTVVGQPSGPATDCVTLAASPPH